MTTSIWWPTPVQASTWFSAEELARSRAYHQPIARAAVARGIVRLLGVALVQWFTSSLPDTGVLGARWPEAWSQMLIVVPLLALVWWLPSVAADAWFEYKHEPRFGHVPLPVGRFVVSSLGTLLATTGLLALVVASLGALIAVTRWWVVGAVLLAASVMYCLSKLEPTVTRITHAVEPLDEVHSRALQQLASQAEVDNVSFELLGSEAFVGVNALTAGTRDQQRIVVTRDLLDCEPALRDHVIAHELGHLRCGHPRVNLRLSIVSVAVAVVMASSIAVLLDRQGILAPLGPAGIDDLRVMPLLLGLLVGSIWVLAPLVAWFHRAQEREADRLALNLSGPLPTATIRRLHATERADLDPGFSARLFSSHPTPAERMQLSSLRGLGDSAGRFGRVR